MDWTKGDWSAVSLDMALKNTNPWQNKTMAKQNNVSLGSWSCPLFNNHNYIPAFMLSKIVRLKFGGKTWLNLSAQAHESTVLNYTKRLYPLLNLSSLPSIIYTIFFYNIVKINSHFDVNIIYT